MTTYTALPNNDVDQDSAVTQTLMTLLRDNPIAIAEGASGAPKVVADAVALWLNDLAVTTAWGAGTVLSARLKKMTVAFGAKGTNSGGASGAYVLKMAVSTDGGTVWGSDITIGTSSTLATGQSENNGGALVIDLVSGAWRSTGFGGATGTSTAGFNAIRFKTDTTGGTISPTAQVILEGVYGVTP